jgi:hypothetical protein
MGRKFLDHPGGSRIYSCANCDTPLTNRGELVSTRFTGATGRAFLFNKVVNLCFSETENRIMVGGAYNSIIVCVCVTVDRETCSKRCDLQEL